MIVEPVGLMVKYLDSENAGELTNDEREILLFALYCESRDRKSGLVGLAVKRLNSKPAIAAGEAGGERG